ncbi:MAG: hypothetical protein ABFS19_10365 [Thermodesulfobacteriota bacterium]
MATSSSQLNSSFSLYRRCSTAVILLIIGLSLSSCGGRSLTPGDPSASSHYEVKGATRLIERYAPIFLVEENQLAFNRPGTAKADRDKDGKIRVTVDNSQPSLYFEETRFRTPNGSYRNLIYRVHFSEVPPLHLISGHNVGLIFITTLNEDLEPLLYTLVHTCGCYLAFVPTYNLPVEYLPDGWPKKYQRVYGEKLPSFVVNNSPDNDRPLIVLRSETHRVKDFRIMYDKLQGLVSMKLRPMTELRNLPVGNITTSFFEEDGKRKGYVKGSRKFWERLLISWWALDPRVGEDKDLGPVEETGTVFYTSLKPWARWESDLWKFPEFLEYWGWKF